LSKEQALNKIFLRVCGLTDPETGIPQPGKGIAEPGDLLFFITHFVHKPLEDELIGKGRREMIRPRRLGWLKQFRGLDRNDLDLWHIGIYLKERKRKKHQRINLWMIHSTVERGVHIQQISPGYFTNSSHDERTRMEILRFKDIATKQRHRIIYFANSKLGSEFDSIRSLRFTLLPFMVGVKNIFHNQNRFSCQQLAIAAYANAGIYFRHPYKSFPICNIGRLLGHPLGHFRDKVDPRDPYLSDQHLYRDPRFELKAAIWQDQTNGEIRLEEENLQKYSWNEVLRKKYLK